MKRLGASWILLAAAVAMFVTACAEVDHQARTANENLHQPKSRVAAVTNSHQQQVSLYPDADYDFGDAAAYYNLHPEGGK